MKLCNELMPSCRNCPYWEIASQIDNDLGICNMCHKYLKDRRRVNGGVAVDSINVFFSQPMRNRDEQEIQEQRQKMIDYARKLTGKEVIEVNPYYKASIDSKNMPLKLLGISIELLAEADMAIFGFGWSVARGCRIEHACAEQYNVKIIDLED